MKRRPRRIGVLFSGGLDSAALIGFLLQRGFEVWPIYVRSGLRWEKSELATARRFIRAIHNRRLKPLKLATLTLEDAYRNNWSQKGVAPNADTDDTAVFLPARNLLLLTKALLLLFSESIFNLAIATLKGNPFPDGKRSYFRLLERVLSGGFNQQVAIIAPFRDWDKAAVIQETRGYPIHLTLSCLAPKKGLHCGECNKCAERRLAFAKSGVADRTRYAA